jgi:hypothetical protein
LGALEYLRKYVAQFHQASDLVLGCWLRRFRIGRVEQMSRLPSSFLGCFTVDVRVVWSN